MNVKYSSETLSKAINEFDQILHQLSSLRKSILGRFAIEKSLILSLEQTSRTLKSLHRKNEFKEGYSLADQELKQLIEVIREKRCSSLHRIVVKTSYSIAIHAARERMRQFKIGADTPQQTKKNTRYHSGASQKNSTKAEPKEVQPLEVNFDSKSQQYVDSIKCCFVLTLSDFNRSRDLLEQIFNLKGLFEIFVLTHDFLLRNQLEEEILKQQAQMDRGDIHFRVKFIPNHPSPYGWLITCKEEIAAYDVICQLHDDFPRNFSDRNVGALCFHHLLGSQSIFDAILHAFETDSQLGMVLPPSQKKQDLNEPWEHHVSICRAVLEDHSNHSPTLPLAIPEHSMFWVRTKSLIIEELKGLELLMENTPTMNWVAASIISSQDFRIKTPSIDVDFDTAHFLSENRNFESILQRLQKRSSTTSSRLPPNLKVAVCRCIVGDYETLLPQFNYSDQIDYWLITDNLDQPCAGPYAKILSNFRSDDPRLVARYVKTHLHQIFSHYDFVVWMDGSLIFTGEIEDYILMTLQGGFDVGLIYHPKRNNCFEELEENIRVGKADENQLIAQRDAYLHIPELTDYPLMETGFMTVDLRSERVTPFFTAWWNQICKFTARDQISLSYAFYESKIKFCSLLPYGKNVRNDHHFALAKHSLSKDVLPYVLNAYKSLE